MKAAEKSLLTAVRNRLRLAVLAGGAGYADNECEVEFDELAPATVGHVYVAVMPGGWAPGPRHKTCGGINDLVYGVDVLVVKRVTHIPRDRKRDVFLNNLDALTEEIDKIYSAIDFSYPLLNAANALILAATGSSEGFMEPLNFAGVDKRPREVNPELFNDVPGKTKAGMARTIMFHGARRMTHK